MTMVTFAIALVAVIAASILSFAQNNTYYEGCLTAILGLNFANSREQTIYIFLLIVAQVATLWGFILRFGMADLSFWQAVLTVFLSILLGLLGPLLAIAIIRVIIMTVIAIIHIIR